MLNSRVRSVVVPDSRLRRFAPGGKGKCVLPSGVRVHNSHHRRQLVILRSAGWVGAWRIERKTNGNERRRLVDEKIMVLWIFELSQIFGVRAVRRDRFTVVVMGQGGIGFCEWWVWLVSALDLRR